MSSGSLYSSFSVAWPEFFALVDVPAGAGAACRPVAMLEPASRDVLTAWGLAVAAGLAVLFCADTVADASNAAAIPNANCFERSSTEMPFESPHLNRGLINHDFAARRHVHAAIEPVHPSCGNMVDTTFAAGIHRYLCNLQPYGDCVTTKSFQSASAQI